ncbi:MAG: HAMP domain-containing sensor histidine kinase [Paludibacter sp.]|nr:HAMP domain-containing sensor histidine kinase [Paludibacter sp.]
MKQLVYLLLLLLACVFTFLSHRLIPEKSFDSYILKLDSVWPKQKNEQEYFTDIDNDSVCETLIHHNINIPGHSIELKQKNKLREIYIFRHDEIFVSSNMQFADINGNHNNEILFVSADKHAAYLNILTYISKNKLLYPVEKIKIDNIRLYGGKADVVNNFIIANKHEIFLDLQGGYSVQPRNIYKYDLQSKTLIKTQLNSLVNPEATLFNYQNQSYLLASYVKSTGNTLCHKEILELKNSTNKDTIEAFKSIKHLEYDYGDFSSYILLYNHELQFAFQPIEFFGWTNFTKSAIIDTDTMPCIISLTNAQLSEPENLICKLMTVCNLQGKILNQKALPHNFTHLYTHKNKAVFWGGKNLCEYSSNLDEITKVDNITAASGYYNISPNNNVVFIAFANNTLKVLSVNGLKTLASFKIEHEFAPYPVDNHIYSVFFKGHKSFIFNTELYYYLFSLSKNNYAWLEFPVLVLIFIFWASVLFFIININTKRLENEKRKLEKIVDERTHELGEKNKTLIIQKSEIEVQARQLETQNKHLEELDKFKQTFIGTIVHDLKNPLGQILSSSKDNVIQQLTRRMLLLVTNLLDVEKYEHTQLIVNREIHPLNAIIKQVVENFDVSLKNKNIFVQIKGDGIDVYADQEILIRVLENLLSNAIRFSPANETIEIDVQMTTDSTATLSIINHGENIPEQLLSSIFEKYSQSRILNSSGYHSTGLGLTFCKMAVEAHGNTIKAENLNGAVRLSFTLDAKLITSRQSVQNIKPFYLPQFSEEERRNLVPFIALLKEKEIYQISDIFSILENIKIDSHNIMLFKQGINNAVINSNTQLYIQLLDTVIIG